MSLRLLRCAPSPLRVPGRVLGVGSLRTLSRPDTSPGFNTWSLHSFGFHPLSQIGSPGGHRMFLQRRTLTRRSFETVAPSRNISSSVAVWVNQGVALPGCPLSPDGHNYVHPAVPTLLPTCSTKASDSASTVCKALGALARPQSQRNRLEGDYPCNNTCNECPRSYSDFAKDLRKNFLGLFLGAFGTVDENTWPHLEPPQNKPPFPSFCVSAHACCHVAIREEINLGGGRNEPKS